LWMSLADEVLDKSRAEQGLGYRDGFNLGSL
jgi:hypothetical protein